MSEDNTRVSFRKDKLSESLKLNKNKFGHTITNESNEQNEPNVELTLAGFSVDAHVDIFESPHLQKFISENNLNIQQESENQIEDIEIDLGEELKNNNIVQTRPKTLEEFDQIADRYLGESRFKKTTQNPEPSSANLNKNKTSEHKPCHNCNMKIRFDAKFCPECGNPQMMANFCKNCGNKYDGSEKFCSECGTKRQ